MPKVKKGVLESYECQNQDFLAISAFLAFSTFFAWDPENEDFFQESFSNRRFLSETLMIDLSPVAVKRIFNIR